MRWICIATGSRQLRINQTPGTRDFRRVRLTRINAGQPALPTALPDVTDNLTSGFNDGVGRLIDQVTSAQVDHRLFAHRG